MNWNRSKFTSSLMNLLGDTAPALTPESRLQEIRQVMLDSLDGLEESHPHARLRARLRCAPDIQGLWYLRTEMMAVLAGRLGEAVAMARLAAITARFNGLLPAAQKARPRCLRP